MPYLKGKASSFDDLIDKIVTWCTDKDIHGDDVWELVRKEPWPRGTIMRAPGWEAGEKQYIGLMTQSIKVGRTYNDWIKQRDNMLREFVLPTFGNLPNVKISGGTVTYGSEEHTNYFAITEAEIFDSDCQALWFGDFKQYSEGLDWDEQAGFDRPPLVNCNPIWYVGTGMSIPTHNSAPPAYPGVGFPAIGCGYSGFINGECEFWLVKGRNNLIVVTLDQDQWDVGGAGFLQPHHRVSEYPFPGCVFSSKSGVIPHIDFKSLGGSIPTAFFCYKFGYNHDSWQLSRALPTMASVYTQGVQNERLSVSQVQLMLPTGEWQSFASYGIYEDLVVVPGTNGTDRRPVNGYPVNKPAGQKHVIYPTYNNLSGLVDYMGNDPDKHCYHLEPIELVEQIDNDRTNMFGSLWNIKFMAGKPVRYGEQTIGGKKFLILPSGYEGRKFHLYHGLTWISDPLTLRSMDAEIDRLTRQMNCAIELE